MVNLGSSFGSAAGAASAVSFGEVCSTSCCFLALEGLKSVSSSEEFSFGCSCEVDGCHLCEGCLFLNLLLVLHNLRGLSTPKVHFKNWHNPQLVLAVQWSGPTGPQYTRVSVSYTYLAVRQRSVR